MKLRMNSAELRNRIAPIIEAYDNDVGSNFDAIYECAALINEYLMDNPQDTEWLLRLADLYVAPPVEDQVLTFETLERIFAYDPLNLQAILMYAFFEFYFFGTVSEKTLTKVEFAPQKTCCDASMVLLAMARYYEYIDEAKKKLMLKKSAIACAHCIEPWRSLAYGSTGTVEGMVYGNHVLRFIARNAHLINQEYEELIINLDQFFDEWYRGYFVMPWVIKDMQRLAYGRLNGSVSSGFSSLVLSSWR